MLFPALVFIEDDKAYGVSPPDIPGCNTAGDDLEEAVELSLEEATIKPEPGRLEDYARDPVYEGAVWVMVNVDLGYHRNSGFRGTSARCV